MDTNLPGSISNTLSGVGSRQLPATPQPAAPTNTAATTPGVTQLDFNQAMSDFKTMFPDMPEDIIEAVLRSNKGIVDATIDELLKISTQQDPSSIENNSHNLNNHNSNRLNSSSTHSTSATSSSSFSSAPSSASSSKQPYHSSSSSSSAYHPNHNVPNTSSATATTKKGFESSYNTSNYWNAQIPESSSSVKSYSKSFLNFSNDKPISKDSLRYRNNWNPPLLGELPAGFLRISMNETQRKLTANVGESGHHHPGAGEASLINSSMLQAKMEENERNRQTASQDDPEIAQFLADERFAILLQNEEFVRELRLNQDFMSTLDGGYHSRPGTGEGSSQPSSSNISDSDAAFKERLKNMSKVSKRKFAQLARLFSGKSKKNFQHKQLDDAGAGSDYQYCEDFSNENYEDFRSRGRIN